VYQYVPLIFPSSVVNDQHVLDIVQVYTCWSQWPRSLRCRSPATYLLRLWVQIPSGVWMFVVSTVCCQVEVSGTD
jgi:hypothetical protein